MFWAAHLVRICVSNPVVVRVVRLGSVLAQVERVRQGRCAHQMKEKPDGPDEGVQVALVCEEADADRPSASARSTDTNDIA